MADSFRIIADKLVAAVADVMAVHGVGGGTVFPLAEQAPVSSGSARYSRGAPQMRQPDGGGHGGEYGAAGG